jgi:parallel beta-helix repeat protein
VPAGAVADTLFVNPFDSCPGVPVPSYPSIQAAVDDSVAGDEIRVCPGLYSATTDVHEANLSLVAIGHVTLTDGIPCLNIVAPGVLVRGFEMAGCDGAVRLVSDDATIENNIIRGGSVAVTVGGNNNVIRNNLVREATDIGISIAGISEGTVVNNNTVRNNAIGINVTAGGNMASPLVITKNLVQHNTGTGIAATGAEHGVISFNSVSFNDKGIVLTGIENFFITRNNASRNTPGPDCEWDGFNPVTVTFKANTCRTETPPGAWD